MRSKELVSRVILGESVEIISQSSGRVMEITGETIQGRGPVLYVDGKEASLGVIECEHGRSPLLDPMAADLSDWYFEEA